MRLRSAIAALAVCTTSAALLAGCSPDPVAAAPAPTTSSTRPAPSPPSVETTPTPTMPAPMPSPTPPPEMSQDDEAGAVAAATYFLTDLYEYTLSTQDLGPWQAMSHEECIYCRSIADAVDEARAVSQVTHPGTAKVTLSRSEMLNPLSYGVTLDITAEPDELWSLSGELLETGEPFSGSFQVVVHRRDSAWLIRGVDYSATEE